MYTEQILLAILAAINILAFFITGSDKRKSMRGGNPERTPEGLLFSWPSSSAPLAFI